MQLASDLQKAWHRHQSDTFNVARKLAATTLAAFSLHLLGCPAILPQQDSCCHDDTLMMTQVNTGGRLAAQASLAVQRSCDVLVSMDCDATTCSGSVVQRWQQAV
jgi:hypothetical protein